MITKNIDVKNPVYFFKFEEIDKIKNYLPEFLTPLGIKVHFGEEGNISFIKADVVKKIIDLITKPVFVETSVLYKSRRRTAAGHREVAEEHGFDFAEIDFIDGAKGDDSIEIKINQKHFEICHLGAGLNKYKSLLVISHFKGHGGAGFGGAIKNLGMGFASRRGKLAQHASIKHKVNQEKCLSCGRCLSHCPANALSFAENKKAVLNENICISCSKCISVCPSGAINIPWESTGTKDFQERIAEYALAVAAGRQCFYINFIANIVDFCDCSDQPMKKLTDDIGLLVADNPTAIDQASYDLVVGQYPGFKEHEASFCLDHAEKIGLGARNYKIFYRN